MELSHCLSNGSLLPFTTTNQNQEPLTEALQLREHTHSGLDLSTILSTVRVLAGFGGFFSLSSLSPLPPPLPTLLLLPL